MTRYGATRPRGNPYSKVRSGRREDLNNRFFRSSWEANFARYLNFLIENGDIAKWEYEPERFEFAAIKRGTTSYMPDFKVWDTPESAPYFYEVKGWMDPKSRTKLKRMAKYYPHITVLIFGQKEYKSLERTMSALIPHWE